MKDRSDTIELIDRFFRKELSEREEQDYLRRLEEEPDFKKLHEEQKLVFEGITYTARQDLRNQFNTIDHELPQPRSSWIFYGSIAAGIGILLIAVMFTWSFYQDWNNARLYEQYFNPPDSIERPVGRGADATERAIQAYNEGELGEAENLLERYLNSNTSHSNTFHLALIKMRLGKFGEAEELLNKLLEEDTVLEIYNGTRWYLALTLLKTNRPEEAIPYLRELAGSSFEYRSQAANLLEDL